MSEGVTKSIDVAAGVIFRGDGSFLLGRRAPGTFYPGYWEFPGGKVEAGESPRDALVRELREELGITAEGIRPWVVREHLYEHARVRLHFFEVFDWHGSLRDHVHDRLSWQRAGSLGVSPVLPANGPILKALSLPRFMGITHAFEIGVTSQLARLDAALENGLRLVQVREPGLSVAKRLAFGREVVRRAHACGALVLINGDAGVAAELGADGVHLKGVELARLAERPAFEWVGASCHTRDELQHAAALGLDYALLGAVRPTLTHPGVEGLGWEGFRALAHQSAIPVFGLGGLGVEDMEDARASGAHGIAAIRRAWEA